MAKEDTDRPYIEMAIECAIQCEAEDNRIHPKVGVVVVKDDKVLTKAHRGEINPGDHAEYVALERNLEDQIAAGSTVYTTLEPCTTRNHPKVPCAIRITERKVARVVIGMLDPNPKNKGTGQILLRAANIITDFFPEDLMAQVEDLNREFRASHALSTDDKTRKTNESKTKISPIPGLDESYIRLNSIYWDRNYDRDAFSIFGHLVEIIGGLSGLASDREKIDSDEFVSKAIAWWMTLCGKVGIKSVANVLWSKFPYACAYCQKSPHNQDVCDEIRKQNKVPQWAELHIMGQEKLATIPRTLGSRQKMFGDIYPAQGTEGFGETFARLTEELGELAEAVRVFPAEPGYFLSEAADVFAWLMHLQNLREQKKKISLSERGLLLEEKFAASYPDYCLDCKQKTCVCPPILPSTVGRIANEVQGDRGSYSLAGAYVTPEQAAKLFRRLAK